MNIERPTSNVEWEKAANREPLNREHLLNSFAVRRFDWVCRRL